MSKIPKLRRNIFRVFVGHNLDVFMKYSSHEKRDGIIDFEESFKPISPKNKIQVDS